MTRSRRGFSSQVRSPRRKTAWTFGPGGVSASSFSASSALIHPAFLQFFLPKITLARIRGRLDLFLISSTAAPDGFQGAVGIGVATLDAVTAGPTAVPSASANSNWDGWLWHQFCGIHASEASSTGSSALSLEVDTKAMRKVTDDDAIFISMEFAEIGTADMDVFMETRMLVLFA